MQYTLIGAAVIFLVIVVLMIRNRRINGEIILGKKAWDYDLHEGTQVRMKYLPERPNYAIRVE